MLFDYVLHHINEANIATGVPEYVPDEIQPLASLLSLANAPEAFHISVNLGVDRIGELLRRSVSSALSRFADSEQLNIVIFLFWLPSFLQFIRFVLCNANMNECLCSLIFSVLIRVY